MKGVRFFAVGGPRPRTVNDVVKRLFRDPDVAQVAVALAEHILAHGRFADSDWRSLTKEAAGVASPSLWRSARTGLAEGGLISRSASDYILSTELTEFLAISAAVLQAGPADHADRSEVGEESSDLGQSGLDSLGQTVDATCRCNEPRTRRGEKTVQRGCSRIDADLGSSDLFARVAAKLHVTLEGAEKMCRDGAQRSPHGMTPEEYARAYLAEAESA